MEPKIAKLKFLEPLYIHKQRAEQIVGVEGIHRVLNWTQHLHNQYEEYPEPFDGSAPLKENRKKHRKTRARHPQIRLPNKEKSKKSHLMNLSNVPLSEAEMSILEKGLLYIPTPKGKTKLITDSINRYQRNLRLDYLFKDTDPGERHPFKPKSSFNPSTSGNPTLEKYLRDTEIELNKTNRVNKKPCSSNLSSLEMEAIKTLKDKINTIVIKKADKGSTLTLVTREKYVHDGELHLNDESSYKREVVKLCPETQFIFI